MLFVCLFAAALDERHKFIRQVVCGHTCTNVHMEAAKTHFLKYFNLTAEFFRLEIAVPCPERSASVFACGIPEKFIAE